MTNTALFREFSSQLAELEMVCTGMDERVYREFKHEVMKKCDARAREFLTAVLLEMDKKREDAECY